MAAKGDNRGVRRQETVGYTAGDELVDHKGRSKPIYKPSAPRPREWRPGAFGRLMMGLFPGLRLMVIKNVPAGLPYALLGLLSGLGAILLVLNWSVSEETIRQLDIQPRWLLLRAGAVLVLAGVYELLRLGAALEELPGGPVIPRVMAALPLPAFLVVFMAPPLLYVAPRLLEATWFAAFVLGFGALPAAVACVLEELPGAVVRRVRLGAGLALAMVAAAAVCLPVLGIPLFAGLESAARAAGFRVLVTLIP